MPLFIKPRKHNTVRFIQKLNSPTTILTTPFITIRPVMLTVCCRYWGRVIWEASLLTLGLFEFGLVFVALFLPCLMARGQMMVLIRMLRDDEEEVRSCVIFHQKIIGSVP